jgi:hypothetical protein
MPDELSGELLQKLVVKTVLWLLDTNERRGFRIFKQEQIRKHLQSAVRHTLLIERIRVTLLIESKQKPAVLTSFVGNRTDPRNFPGDRQQGPLEAVRMSSLNILNDISQILASPIQMLLRSCGRQSSCGVRDEIREIPTLDVGAEPYDPRMLFELTQSRNSEPARIVQLDIQGRGALLGFREVTCPDPPHTIFEAQKGMRPTIFLPFSALKKGLLYNDGNASDLGDSEAVGNRSSLRTLAIVQVEADRPFLPLGSELGKSTPLGFVACRLDTFSEAVGEETKGIQETRFSAAVGTDETAQGRERAALSISGLAQTDIGQGFVVLDPQSKQLGHQTSRRLKTVIYSLA